MLPVLALVFIVVPVAELFVIVQSGKSFGIVPTLAALIVMSLSGAWLVRREGLNVLGRARERIGAGVVPGREIVDGVIVLFAGALLMTPGFLTDAAGLVLVFPATRGVVRVWATAYVAKRLRRSGGPAF